VYDFWGPRPLCAPNPPTLIIGPSVRQSVPVLPMTKHSPEDSAQAPVPKSYDEFEGRLVRALGATIGGEALSRTLGYPTQDAFRKAHKRDRLPVATFECAGRRGRFASTVDIAAWLWVQREQVNFASSHAKGGALAP
jgi:hypothetical protein